MANDTTFIEDGFCHSTEPAVSQGFRLAYSNLDLSRIDLRSIRAALDGFTSVIEHGLKFVGHTGCWTRGLEHALGGFLSSTLLFQWVRCVEESIHQTPEEAQLVGQLRKVLEEGDIHIYPESLAATLARASIQLMDQVWIWGITPFMGQAFRLYVEEILGSRAAIMDVEPVILEDEQGSEYGD